jgi:hypothetical protein
MAYPSWVPVVYTIGDSIPLGVDHAVGTSSTPELARLPTSPMVSREEKQQEIAAKYTQQDRLGGAA